MKLTSAQIQSATRQFEAQPIPQDNRILAELRSIFGEHTYFLDNNGLHIVEAFLAEPDQGGAPAGRIVKVASWTDPAHTTLAAHPPEPTGVVIDLDKAA